MCVRMCVYPVPSWGIESLVVRAKRKINGRFLPRSTSQPKRSWWETINFNGTDSKWSPLLHASWVSRASVCLLCSHTTRLGLRLAPGNAISLSLCFILSFPFPFPALPENFYRPGAINCAITCYYRARDMARPYWIRRDTPTLAMQFVRPGGDKGVLTDSLVHIREK